MAEPTTIIPDPIPDLTESQFMDGLTRVAEAMSGQKSNAPATVSSNRPGSTPATPSSPAAVTAPVQPDKTEPAKTTTEPAPTTAPKTAAPAVEDPNAPPNPDDVDPTATAKPEPVAKPTATEPVPELPRRGPKAEQWRVVNEDRARLRGEKVKLEARIKELETQTHPDFEKVAKERDDYKNLLREIAVERDPEIVGPILEREKKAVEMVKRAIPEDQQAEVLDLLQKPPSDARDEALSKVMEGLSLIKQNRLDTARREFEDLQEQRRGLSARSQEAIQKRQEQDQQRRATYVREFQAETADWLSEEKGLDLLRPKAGDEAHNARAKDIMESAQALFSGKNLTPRQFARAAYQAVTQPFLAEQTYALQQKVEELEGVITKLKGGTGPVPIPSGDAGHVAEPTEEVWDPASGETLVQFQMRQMRNQGIFTR